METIRQRLYRVAMEKQLRQSTLYSYERLLGQLGILDMTNISLEDVMDLLWRIDNPNTRRSCVIAVRSVMGYVIKIPKGIPRRYAFPSEDTLRMALMLSPHEVRGLLMMYAGLRIGEACAVTAKQVDTDRLTVDRQVIELHKKGQPTVIRIAPVKTNEGAIVIPHWLSQRLMDTTATVTPSVVRESLRRAGKKVGVSLSPHLLRHWYATTMLERGLPFSLVSRQMRHSDIATTLRTYSQYDASKGIHDAFG